MHCLTAVSPLLILGVVAAVKVCNKLSLLDRDVNMVPGGEQSFPSPDNSSQEPQEPPFTTQDNSSLMLCTRQCQLRSRCQSFIFSLTNGRCSLFSTIVINTTNSSTSQDEVFADNIHSWPSRLAGDCENHTCPQNTVCEGNMSCLVTHCVNPPIIANGSVTLASPNQAFFAIGQVEYTCEPYHLPENILKCQSNGSWLVPNCSPITECKQLKLCNNSYGDGEYWILMKAKNLVRAKIYCGNMHTTEPKHFITLFEDNYSESPLGCTSRCGRTDFTKVEFTLGTLKVIHGSRTFATLTCGDVNFGTTTSCAASESDAAACGQAGTIRIDLRGTGFKVRPGSLWIGYTSASTAVANHSSNWDVVNVSCYAQVACKPCVPGRDSLGKSSLFFEVDENAIPETITAVVPQCTYLY